ncbi:MAG: helix-turn-helix transcriptional regulator [Lachnospiraceae bacterium]|nr:helix-turn-helix transcriptional regulator [Lachnospiraceae bacterium]
MNFGEKLRSLRKGSNLTQQQLGELLGVAKSVVSYYEQGDRCPSQDVLIRIASVFHTSTDYLLGLEKKRTLDVSDLDDEDVKVLENMANALRSKKG